MKPVRDKIVDTKHRVLDSIVLIDRKYVRGDVREIIRHEFMWIMDNLQEAIRHEIDA